MNDGLTIEELQEKYVRLNSRVYVLEQTLIPLIATLIGDRSLGDTLPEILAKIEGHRHRVKLAIKAGDADPELQAAMIGQLDSLFDNLAAMSAAVAFDVENGDGDKYM